MGFAAAAVQLPDEVAREPQPGLRRRAAGGKTAGAGPAGFVRTTGTVAGGAARFATAGATG